MSALGQLCSVIPELSVPCVQVWGPCVQITDPWVLIPDELLEVSNDGVRVRPVAVE